jgi:hypothetical protein
MHRCQNCIIAAPGLQGQTSLTPCQLAAPEAHVSHECAHLLRHHEQEIDHVLRLALELGTQLRVLQEEEEEADERSHGVLKRLRRNEHQLKREL